MFSAIYSQKKKYIFFRASQVALVVENPPASAGDVKSCGVAESDTTEMT